MQGVVEGEVVEVEVEEVPISIQWSPPLPWLMGEKTPKMKAITMKCFAMN